MKTKKSPQLRIAVTPDCNLHCVYCRPGGEGYYENLENHMSASEIREIIRISTEVGITHVKFTGGEPLLRSDIVNLVEDAFSLGALKDIQIVTNGMLLAQYADALKRAGISSITISIDATDPDKYAQIRSDGKLDCLLTGLHRCRDIGLPVRLNVVLMRSNVDQLEGLLKLAGEVKASLKLLDLLDVHTEGSHNFWRREFYPFNDLCARLEGLGAVQVGYEEAPGGIGAPLLDYRMPNGLQVVAKDSMTELYYHKSCFDCHLYPCQDAIISLKLTHDGHLKRCLIRNDNIVDILSPLRNGDVQEVKRLIAESFKIMVSSKSYMNKWHPSMEPRGDLAVSTGA